MMIFPKKLPQDRAPQEAAPAQPPSAAAESGGRLPETWRVVLEDGSTSGAPPEKPTSGAGRKLMAEVTEAVSGHVERKHRQARPRSIAMPPSPRQSLQALDASFVAKAARPGKTPGLPRSSPPKTQSPPNAPRKSPDRRPPEAAIAAVESSGLLADRAGAARRELDARLTRVIELWPQLPRGIQAAIIAMVDAESA